MNAFFVVITLYFSDIKKKSRLYFTEMVLKIAFYNREIKIKIRSNDVWYLSTVVVRIAFIDRLSIYLIVLKIRLPYITTQFRSSFFLIVCTVHIRVVPFETRFYTFIIAPISFRTRIPNNARTVWSPDGIYRQKRLYSGDKHL